MYFFVENKQPECFAAALFTCYELIRPDVVLELAWRNELMDFAMPFMVQTFREYHTKLNHGGDQGGGGREGEAGQGGGGQEQQVRTVRSATLASWRFTTTLASR